MRDFPLRLFVYGTLKRGGRYHASHCARARQEGSAFIWGRIHHQPVGYPALEIPERQILARGSGDPQADARRHGELRIDHLTPPTGDWDRISGELMTFSAPRRDIPEIDALEDFRPHDPHSEYQRVMVPAWQQGRIFTVWVYWSPPSSGAERVPANQAGFCEWIADGWRQPDPDSSIE